MTDDNGCIVSSGAIEINEPDVISIVTDNTNNITCNSGNDGRIFVTVSGGTTAYTLAWSGPGGYTSGIEDPSGLFSGDYNLLVTDSRGCTKTHGPITLTQPSAIVISTDITSNLNLLCNDDSDGKIDISVSGGTPGYSYSWTGPAGYIASAQDISGLKAGNYQLIVTDVKNCQETETIGITEPSAINIQTDSLVDVSCFGLDNGSIGVSVSGGTPMGGPLYGYTWTGDLGYSSGSEDLSALPPDNYYLTVTDANSCTADTGPLSVTEPALLTVLTDSTHNVSCNGDNTGAIYISVNGGTIPYNPAWTGPGGFTSSSQDVTGLFIGDYTLHLTDNNGCSFDHGPISISEPSELTVVTDSTRQISCFAADDGAIYTTTGGGSPPYTYAWSSSGSYSSSNPDITGLPEANYTLIVTDSKGCTKSIGPVAIISPAPLNISVVIAASKLSLDCYDDNDGNITLSVTGGTPGYTYAWTGPDGFNSSDRDINGLKAGDYFLTVIDANNCIFSSGAINISQPDLLSVNLVSKTKINCNGAGNGKIITSTTGGTNPYSFAWTGPDGYISGDIDSIKNLEAGNYRLMITDVNGCQDSLPVTGISEPDSIYAIILPTSKLVTGCTGSKDGIIRISVSGGIPGYTYSWKGPGGYSSSSKNIIGLGAGNYNLTITDNNKCQKIYTPLAAISELPAVGVTVEEKNITCNGDNNGQITAHGTGGVSPYEYSRNASIWQNDSVFTGLPPGAYIIFLRDQNKCQIHDTAVIMQPSSLYVGSETKVDSNNVCFGDNKGIIMITAGGGTAPLEFSIDSGYTFYPNNIFTGLTAGEYQTIVRDANGCTVKGNNNVLNQPSQIYISDYSQDNITSCFDAAEGSIFIQSTGGVEPKTYSLDSAEANIFGIFDNVTAGIHLVQIKDSKGCIKDTTVIIAAPPVIIFSQVTITDVTGCNGDSNGAIYSPATGGTGSFQYMLDAGIYQDSARWENMKAGIYTVTARDDNGCTHDTVLTITEPDTIGFSSLDVTPVACRGDENGMITITGSGGNPPYTYTLNPGSVVSATGIFTDLAPGSYNIQINDAGACPGYITDPIVLTDPPLLLFDSTETGRMSCRGADDAAITIFATGGVAPLQYSIDNGNTFSNQEIFEDLPASTYYALVLDANGCIIRGDTILIIEPSGINIDTQTTSDTICYGELTGSINVEASGGTQPLEYTFDSLNWQSSGTFSGLPGGAYLVTIRDINNCTASSDSLIINQFPAIVTDITIVQSFNGEPGSIHISSAGGKGKYEYSINGPAGPFQQDTAFLDLWPSDYEVTVRDESACIHTEIVILDATPSLRIAVAYTDIECYGDSAGTITLSSLNGTGIVEYSIDNGITMQNDSIFSDLPTGTFYIFARDGDRRIFKDTVTITSPDELIISVDTIIPVSCSGLSDGSVQTVISGGVLPYSISWTSDGGYSSNDSVILDLPGDIYEMSVTDGNLCVVNTGPIIVAEPEVLTVTADSINNVICYGFGDGAIYTTITGGTQPYSLLWTGPGNYNSSAGDISGLDTGTYSLVITDAMGCSTNYGPVLITEPDTLSVTIDGQSNLVIKCFGDKNGSIFITADGGTPGYQYFWSGPGGFSSTQEDLNNLNGGDYYLLLYDSHMCVANAGKILISEPPEIRPTADITPASCHSSTYDGSISITIEGGVLPLTFLWSNNAVTRDISGLNSGTYTVLITDADNCSVTADFEVTSISSVRANAGRDTSVCIAERLTLNGSGGENYLWQPESGLSNPNIPDPEAFITGPVSYLLTVSGADGCIDTASVIITIQASQGINAGEDVTAAIGQEIQLSASTEGFFDTYLWQPATGISNPNSRTPLLTVPPLSGVAMYTVTGTSIFGCTEIDTININITGELKLIIYSGFTPNGDGTNDLWDIDFATYYPEIKVMVFNRWGKQVFFSEGYGDEQRWDGTYNGADVPTGTYYYIIDLGTDPVNQDKVSVPISGTVTIIR